MRPICAATAALALMAVFLTPAGGVINPALQPVDLCERHDHVLVLTLTTSDAGAGTFVATVAKSLKGDMKPGRQITVEAQGDMKALLAARVKDGSLARGRPMVAFAGKSQRRSRQTEMLFYYEGGWGVGEMTAADRWVWKGDDRQEEGIALGSEQPQAVSTLGGTWNGSTTMFAALLDDTFARKAYLPRKAYVRFHEELPLVDMGGAGRGVALYDIDQDGKLDIYACGDSGDHLLLQRQPESRPDGSLPPVGFVTGGEYMGLPELASPSCSVADVNGDGLPDLLIGGAIYIAADRVKDRFTRTELLAASAGEKLISAAFAELNADGWPDVVASYEGGGLRAYINPGDGGAFRDATKSMGLDLPRCGAGLTGFFDVGDWNDDGRADIFYGAAAGLLLVQDSKGLFVPMPHDANLSMESGPQRLPAQTGAACFAPILGLLPDLMVPMESSWAVLANEKTAARDITAAGGEISEASFGMLATIADDFNHDGYVDFFTVARGDAGQNRLLLNRGYGTFMHADPHRYYQSVFSSGIVESGGWGAAAGDVDGDGSSDLVVTNGRGELVLVLNQTLALRARKDPYPIDDLKALREMRVLKVQVRGRGALGSRVSVLAPDKRPLAVRYIGGNVATGCRGPDEAIMTLRGAGSYLVQVRYGDGHLGTGQVDLRDAVSHVVMTRGGPSSLPATAGSSATSQATPQP
jgi:hypothetical protein